MPYTPRELASRIADRVKADRLARGWTQQELAGRAGLPFETYRLFERTGKTSLERLIAISAALGRAGEWEELFRPRPQSLDDVDAARPGRQRGTPRRRKSESE